MRAAVAALAFLICAPPVVAQSAKDIKKIEDQRTKLFGATSTGDQGFGGVDYGEGGYNWVHFLIGRGDRLYYYAHTYGMLGTIQTDTVHITCWKLGESGARKAWRLPFVRGRDETAPLGALLKHARSEGYVPDRRSPQWKFAKAELERVEPLVVYDYPSHGAGPEHAQVGIMGLDLHISGREGAPVSLYGTLHVPQAELRLMKTYGPFKKG